MSADHGFSVVGYRTLIDVGFLRIGQRTIATPTGNEVDRIVVAHPGAVAVVPQIGDHVVLVEQYRAAVDSVVLEIPAGKLDREGEEPWEAARRELSEETGFTAHHLVHLTDLLTSVGFSDERISIYLATDLVSGEPQPVGEEEEAAEIVTMPWSDAVDAVVGGTITDAKTVAGILLAEHRRGTS